MCGIAGFQGRFSRELLNAMVGVIAHRGPDGDGSIVFDEEAGIAPVGLGHRRLAIIDLSDEGRQPMTTRCEACRSNGLEDLALTYNGEIYNYRELWDDLRARGHTPHSATDSEVLLHLYAEYGLDALAKLNGIFAFAIRDGRAHGRPDGVRRGDLVVARDQLGVKPLYHTTTRDGFLFASELKALLRSDRLERALDPVAIHQQLAYLWIPAPRTALRDVSKLRPGTVMIVRDGAIAREWSFYDIPMGRPRLSGSESEIAAEVHSRVEKAVQRQLVADVPVGAFLSGGLDSSAVVAMMRKARPAHRPVCYAIGFAEEGIDGAPADLPYARKVAAHLDVELREIIVEPRIIERLDDMLFHLDEPQADPAPINALLICERARSEGFKVLLSGAGGDDIFSGYRRHRAIQSQTRWSHVPRFMREAAAATARRQAAGGLAINAPWFRRTVKLFEHADLPMDERTVSYFWWSGEALRRGLYSPAFAAQVDREDTAAPLLESLARIPHEGDPLNRMLYLEGKHFLADHNLNYTDKMGMACGVEVRVPLLDPELVDYASRIPPHMKQRGSVGKAIFKTAMEAELPRDVIYRPKTGFGAPLRRWIRNELAPLVSELLSPESLTRRGLFDPAAVQRLTDADRAGRVDGAYTIFALVCLELWCRQFVDGGRI